MSSAATRDDERRLIAEVSADRLMESTRAISQWVRLSGTPDEAKAFDWVEKQMRAYGYAVTRYAHPGLVSWPEAASLTLMAGGTGGAESTIACYTHGFAASTGPEGLGGELVDAGRATPAELAKADVRGKIAFVEGPTSPERNLAVERAGAVGSVWAAGERFHETNVSPVWGAPTPETGPMLPKTPSVSLIGADAARVREALRRAGGSGARASVRVRLVTRVYRAWHQLPLLICDLRPGGDVPEADDFVLLSGHIDSWHYGAVDNGTADAAMLETAYLLAQHRAALRRGFRVAFWSGHSHARYGGSTWYADAFWQEIHERCVAHVYADSLGEKGAVDLTSACAMTQLRDFAAGVVKEVSGQDFVGRRVSRAGDQSFWGHGVPSLFMLLSEQAKKPTGERGGHSPWWHTPEDTVDKVDVDFLVRDAKVYALACYRLCAAAILPFDYRAAIEEILADARNLEAAAKGHVDLSPVTARLAELAEPAAVISDRLDRARRAGPPSPAAAARLNAGFKRLAWSLVPVDYIGVNRFDQDLAVAMPSLPALRPAERLASLTPGTDEYEFVRTKLLRDRNRIVFALTEARRAMQDLLAAAGVR